MLQVATLLTEDQRIYLQDVFGIEANAVPHGRNQLFRKSCFSRAFLAREND
jgi:hypothetical protein